LCVGHMATLALPYDPHTNVQISSPLWVLSQYAILAAAPRRDDGEIMQRRFSCMRLGEKEQPA